MPRPRVSPAGAVLGAALLLGALAPGCSSGPAAPSDAALGEEFTLAPGASATAGPDAVSVQFVAVLEDSRCPADAVCVQAGRVLVDALVGGQRRQMQPADVAPAGSDRVRLVRVEPYPTGVATIPPAQYRATFVVVRP